MWYVKIILSCLQTIGSGGDSYEQEVIMTASILEETVNDKIFIKILILTSWCVFPFIYCLPVILSNFDIRMTIKTMSVKNFDKQIF